MLLSKTELKELTGTNKRVFQALWLKKNSWVYVLDLNDWPRVSRDYALMRLGVPCPGNAESEPEKLVTPVTTKRKRRSTFAHEPNFAAFGG
ncbi:DUF4224 domain-containing protein [Chitinimonas sp. PSY-7]|uniref:DUF4224 domain-containing protein n=1 Tax=Chitinimonas sp. PSY-7 TaxID=3459088 RepID=UPI004040231B